MIIRKISIGPDLKSGMHFSVGHSINITIQDAVEQVVIHSILENRKTNKVDVYIKKVSSGEVFVWKSVSKNTPHTFEYDLNF